MKNWGLCIILLILLFACKTTGSGEVKDPQFALLLLYESDQSKEFFGYYEISLSHAKKKNKEFVLKAEYPKEFILSDKLKPGFYTIESVRFIHNSGELGSIREVDLEIEMKKEGISLSPYALKIVVKNKKMYSQFLYTPDGEIENSLIEKISKVPVPLVL